MYVAAGGPRSMLTRHSARLHGSPVANLWQGRCRTAFLYIGHHIDLCAVQGSIFGPYTPLQQLDLLADHGTKSYVVGSTNSLLLQQKDRYSDVLVNVCSSPNPVLL